MVTIGRTIEETGRVAATGRDISRKFYGHMAPDHKFGFAVVGTSFVPVCQGLVFRTPQVSGATALRVKAGDANDAPGGTGARAVTIVGVLADGTISEETIATNGAAAGPDSAIPYIRLLRAWVKESGTYASQSAGSHAGDIVIENAAGTEDWGTISSADFSLGQSQIGATTFAIGRKAYLEHLHITTDSSKAVDILIFQRENILETAAPYTAMRVAGQYTGLTGEGDFPHPLPRGPYVGPCDFGVMAKVATGSAAVSVEMHFLLEDA